MDKKNKRVYLSNTKEERAININQFFTLYVDFSKNNTAMKSTITTPDELTTLRIEGSSGTYKYSVASAPWNPLHSWMQWTGSIIWRK